MKHVTGARAPVLAYQALVDKSCGYPSSAHVHVGAGRHVEVDPHVPGPGWTLHHADVREHHKTKGLFAHVAVDVSAAAPLTLEERAQLLAANDEAVELENDWQPTEASQI